MYYIQVLTIAQHEHNILVNSQVQGEAEDTGIN